MAQSASFLEWVSAVGQVAGAIGTFAAVIVALRFARLDGRRIRAELADREAGQARLVTFEVVRRSGRWRVAATNHSAAPVFDVRVTNVRYGEQIGHIETIPGSPDRHAILPAGQTLDQAVWFDDPELTGGREVSAAFVDAAGLRWQRIGADPPRRIITEPA